MEFLQYGFMQRALLAGSIIAIICPLVGSFLILKRLSMIGDALSHTSMAGIAIGLIIGINPTITALVIAVLASIVIDFLRKNFKKYEELSIAIIMAAGLGLGIILITIGGGDTANVMSYLFGSIIAISTTDLISIIVVSLLVFVLTIILYNKLFYLTFDEEAAKIKGLATAKINMIFLILTSLTIVVCIKITGILLTSALITLPVASGLQVAKSFRGTTIYSMVFAQLSVFIGLITSFYLDLPPGGTIILSALLLLFMAIGFKKLHK